MSVYLLCSKLSIESCEWLLVHLCASLDRVTHMYHLQSDKDTAYNLDLAL